MQEKEIIDLAKRKASENGFEGEAADVFVSAFVENFKKGYAEGRGKIAKKMLLKGMNPSDIAGFTGLSIDEIKSLG